MTDYFRVGDEWGAYGSPGWIDAKLEALRGYIEGIARDASRQAGRLSENWRAGWTDFLMRWGGFYRDARESTIRRALPNLLGTYDQLLEYTEEAKRWAADLRAQGLERTNPPTLSLPTRPERGLLESLNPLRTSAGPFAWALLGVGVLGLAVAWKRS